MKRNSESKHEVRSDRIAIRASAKSGIDIEQFFPAELAEATGRHRSGYRRGKAIDKGEYSHYGCSCMVRERGCV